MTEKTIEKITEKLSNDSAFLDNPELKNTLVLEDKEYNINAVTAVVAEQTQADFTFNASLIDEVVTDKFDGSADKTINYVPSDGGEFTGTVQINKNNYRVDSTEKDEIVNYGQIETAIKLLDGAPLYTWDAANDYTAVKNAEGQNYKLNTVIGSVEDLPVFEAYSEGKAHSKYVTPDSYDKAYITYSTDTVREASFNPAYDNIKNTITKLVFNGDLNPNNKVKIKGTSFNNMRGLISVHLNSGVSELGDNAFSGCASLKSIEIPDSVETIGASAFAGCTALTGVVLGSRVTEIKTYTFQGCSNLKSIAICGNVTSIDSTAFSGCEKLTKIYFNGTQEDWNRIKPPSAPSTIIPIDGTSFPFLYICKDPDIIDTSLTSNKMLLKLPNKPLVEISKGAARLERRDSKTTGNVDYFTYDVLAAVIAGINSRLTALGSSKLALPTTLATATDTKHTVIPSTLVTSEEISKELHKESGAVLVTEDIVPSVQDLEQDIEDLKVELLDGIAGNFATKTVGGITAGSQIDSEITVSELLKTILGIKSGVAPSGFTFSIKSTNSNTSSITAPLDQTSETIEATWSVSNGGTYTGNYTPTIGGVTGTAAGKAGGTVSGITVTFDDSDTSKSISGSASYSAATGFEAGTLNGGSKSLTINRTCYYGPANGTLSTTNRTSKTGWNIKTSTAIVNDYFIFQYPKAWGKLSSVTDNDTSYEALTNSETFDKTPTEVTKNGGTYYQYKTNKLQNGNLNFTTKS